MPVELFIAIRYLKAKRKGFYAIVTTFIAVGGVALGVAALIITLSVMSGFHADIKEKILGLQPHIMITSFDQSPLYNPQDTMNKIKGFKGVQGVAPFIFGQVILRSKFTTSGAVIKGINWDSESTIAKLSKKIIKPASGISTIEDNGAILGSELSKNLGVSIGDSVVAMAPGELGFMPRVEKLKVCAIMHSGMYEYDSNLFYTNIASAGRLFGVGENAVSGISVALSNIENSASFSKLLRGSLGPAFAVRSWQDLNRNLFSALELEKIMMFIILTLIVLVAAFNTVSNLLLLTMEKSKEIGMLCALGFKRGIIGRIFFIEGVIIGSLGTGIGLTVGIGLSLLLKKYQFIHLPAEVYYIDRLPVKIVLGDIAVVAICAFIISAFAALYPAIKASKLDPIEAIRY